MVNAKPPVANVLPPPSESGARREGIDAVLAKNLVVARVLAGLTQRQLAEASLISRATIAQLETGYSDPRLSTLVDLASALEIPLIFLLLGMQEVRAMSVLLETAPPAQLSASAPPSHLSIPTVPAPDLARMREYIRSGMLKDRMRAAQLGASLARAAGANSPSTSTTAGIFSAILPGSGTIVGALLAELLDTTT